MKILLAGCGGISRAWLSALADIQGAAVCGLVDICRQRAEEAARKFELEDAFVSSDLEKALGETRPDIVFNCTVPEAHFTTTSLCLRTGSHVFSEKPMAASMEEAEELCSISEKSGKVLAVMQNRRFDPNLCALRRFLIEGSIGALSSFNSDFYRGSWFEGFRRKMRHVLLLDMAVHTFDAARFLSREEPVSVYCREWNPPGSWFRHGASAHAIFEMSDGSIYSYRGSWTAPGLHTSWQSEWRVTGASGSVQWDGEERIRAEILEKIPVGENEARLVEIIAGKESPGIIPGHKGAILDFLFRIREGSLPGTHCEDNIRTLTMVFGAIESAEKGGKINLRTQRSS